MREELGVPPLAFLQLLNSDALQPAAVRKFRRILAREGWAEDELVRRDRQVPVRWFREVYPHLEPDSATRLGLAFAEQAQLTSFGPLSLPLVSAGTVGEVFELLGYLPVISGALRPHFHSTAERLRVGLAGHTGDHALDCLVITYGGTALLRLLNLLAGELDSVMLHLAWDAPRASTPAPPERLVFGANASFIEVPGDVLATPCRFPDPVAYRLAVTDLRRSLENTRQPTTVTEAVRRAVEDDPGNSGRAQVAASLGMSPSTLKRRLDAENTTFRQVRDALLRERAIVRLLDPSLSISQIAVDLGYGDPANFCHAFKRWTGQAPGEFRRAGSRFRTDLADQPSPT